MSPSFFTPPRSDLGRWLSSHGFSGDRSTRAWCALLLSAVCAVYWRVSSFDFVQYDDPEYLLKNPYVAQGLSWGGVVWAFTQIHVGNWHPLTSLSYLIDAELWGMAPGAFHAVNVAPHAANTLLLFGLLRRWTGRETRSAIVAALFAVHPLHVESVAWISERKDVLSGLFFLLTLWAYTAWVARPSGWRYARIALVYAFGLLSKPMVVTLPFVLLLLDHWPLGRIGPNAETGRPDLARRKWDCLLHSPLQEARHRAAISARARMWADRARLEPTNALIGRIDRHTDCTVVVGGLLADWFGPSASPPRRM